MVPGATAEPRAQVPAHRLYRRTAVGVGGRGLFAWGVPGAQQTCSRTLAGGSPRSALAAPGGFLGAAACPAAGAAAAHEIHGGRSAFGFRPCPATGRPARLFA